MPGLLMVTVYTKSIISLNVMILQAGKWQGWSTDSHCRKGSLVAWDVCEIFCFALMTLIHPRHFLISQNAIFRQRVLWLPLFFLMKWNTTKLNQNWARGEDWCKLLCWGGPYLLVCPFSPVSPRKGKLRSSLCFQWRSWMDFSVVHGHGNVSL